MATCPTCQAQIEIGSEFYGGLFTCPMCRAVYFIGFDGTPENSQSQEHVPPVPIPNEIPPISLPDEPPTYSMEPMGEIPQIPDSIPQIPSEIPSLPQEPLVNFDTPIGEMATPPAFSPLKDVVDFANSEDSKSLSSYSVTISGLGLTPNLQALKDVLSDSKLQISFEQVRLKIKNGVLRLEKLNPAQAAVIAFRLRPLSLQMVWEQSFQ